ncbi:acyltransferase family protein [Pseudodesulfovibrio sp. zrk46]|uniref:acyltransferase family protein n=1 Tax=Pseudodesulfovibrio sp. zrk46 TaxID=2725288 RepID=UPI0014494EB9|nr:acyltransferase family protein [Pseudodesulfovibrio sp. zrk46]QJB56230.1 acyltransferase family protein [Pseudodesulfovibrio sp. zrk46]
MKSRDISLDNAKGLLILLVLFGHLAWPVPSVSESADTFYLFVYIFHMPMFALVSGYLSRAEWSYRLLGKSVKRLLLPYGVFMAIQWGIMLLQGKEPYSITEGHFGLWFLFSLFCWRMVLPWLMRLPRPFVVSILLALACGMLPQLGLEFSLARTINFLPFFVAGHLMRSRGISPAYAVGRPAAIVFILLGVGAAVFIARYNLHMLLYGAFSYSAMGMPLSAGPLFRVLQLLLAFGVGLAVLSLIPNRISALTRFGTQSLHIYLLHTPLLALYRAWPAAYEAIGDAPLLMLPMALVVCWVLSSDVVARVTRLLVQPL